MPSRKKKQQAQKAEKETVGGKCYSIIEVDPAGEDPDLLESIRYPCFSCDYREKTLPFPVSKAINDTLVVPDLNGMPKLDKSRGCL